MKPRHVVALCGLGWIALFVAPQLLLPVGYVTYATFALLLGWAALRRRATSRPAGLLLVVLLVTFPAWVLAGYWIFARVTGASPDFLPGLWPHR